MSNSLRIQLLTGFFSILISFATAQTKIKDGSISATSSLPATGSLLELESNHAGLRMPRVALTNTTTWAPMSGSGVASTSPGMSVYNTNAAITSTNANYPANGVGEYNWDGTGWINKNSSITQNSLVLFSVRITATQTMPLSTWTLIDFAAKNYDKNNNYNLSTNKFTVPSNAAGYYQVNVVFATTTQAANQGCYVGVFVNNAFGRYISIGNANAGSGITGSGTIVIQLAAGDVVDLRYNGNTASQDLAYMHADILQLSR